jgi:hypothetical protein
MNKNKTLFGMCWVMFDYDTKLLKEVLIKPYYQANQSKENMINEESFGYVIKIDGNTPEQVRKLMNEYMEKYNLFSNTIYNDLNKNECKTYLGNRHCLRYKKERA